jgi:predicted transcriptional regulator
MSLVSIRPETLDERSRSFILSIDAKWMNLMRNGDLRCVIRKRLPLANEVSSVYFHAKSPASSIFGRAQVSGIYKVAIVDIVARKNDLRMTELEILDYTRGLSQIGIMEFRNFESTCGPVEMESFRNMLDYHPPQSFAFISRSALPVINNLCGF